MLLYALSLVPWHGCTAFHRSNMLPVFLLRRDGHLGYFQLCAPVPISQEHRPKRVRQNYYATTKTKQKNKNMANIFMS